MATFVIHLYRLGEGIEGDGGDLSKLTEQLNFYKEELKKPIVNFRLDGIISEVSDFKKIFNSIFVPFALKRDKYDNRYEPEYRYAELTYDNLARITRIRLLGVGGINSKRYIVENVQNPFSITTLKLIQNIKEIVKSPKELSLEQLFQCKRDAWAKDSDILSGRTLPKYRYSWEYLTANYFSPAPIYDETGQLTDSEIDSLLEEYNKKSVIKRQELEQQLSIIDQNRKRIRDAAKNKREKVETPADKLRSKLGKNENRIGKKSAAIIRNFLDRYSIGCLIQEAQKCIQPSNTNCVDILRNLSPSEIFDRLSLVFPKGSDTFAELEKLVEEQVFGKKISEIKKEIKALQIDLETKQLTLSELQRARDSGGVEFSIIQGIEDTEKQIEEINIVLQQKKEELNEEIRIVSEDLNLSDRQSSELQTKGGNLEVIFATPEEGERIGAASITDKILAAVDTIIPLEDICNIISNLLSGNGLPPFNFPQPQKVNDPFENFSIEISELFALLLTQAIVSFIDGILRDLVNCDNIDSFIAQAINSGRTGNTFDPLKSLFNGRQIDDIVSRNYDSFVSTIARNSNSIFLAGGQKGKKVSIGLQEQDVENILKPDAQKTNVLSDYTTAISNVAISTSQQTVSSGQFFDKELFDKAKQAEANWIVDSTGNKFELTTGTRILDLRELDKYVASLSEEGRRYLREQDKFRNDTGSVVDGNGVDLNANTTQQPFSAVEDTVPTGDINIPREKQVEITEELVCILRHTTSILLPSQVLSLLAGTASEEVVAIADEIVRICSTNIAQLFPNSNSVANMFSTFGNVAGLSSLQDDVRVLIDSPEFSREFLPGKCGPYTNLEEFREELLSRTVGREKAKNIIENVTRARLERANQVTSTLLDFNNGIATAIPQISTNQVLLDAVKAALNDLEYKQEEVRKAREEEKKTAEQRIKDEINRKFNNSPIIQNMLRIALDSFFFPITEVFDRDLEGFIDSFSEINEVETPLERTITVNTARGSITAINPEFKDLINNNLVPVLSTKNGSSEQDRYAKMVEKDSLKTLDILPKEAADLPVVGGFLNDAGLTPAISVLVDDEERNIYISGEPSKNYLEVGFNGVPLRPVLKKTTKKIVGDSFRRNIGNFDLTADADRQKLLVKLSGRMDTVESGLIQQVVENIASIYPGVLSADEQNAAAILSTSMPKWDIVYSQFKENNKIYEDILLNTSGVYYTTSNGTESFYLPKFYSRQEQKLTNTVSQQLIQKYDTIEKSRKQVFDNIFFEKLKPLLFNRQAVELDRQFAISSEPLYSEIIKSFIQVSSRGIGNSGLMKGIQQGSQEVFPIELLNFTDNCQHILDFDCFRQEMSVLLTQLPDEDTTIAQRKGEEPRPSKLSKAALLLLSKMIIKILCFDVILKSLPAFDYFKYSKNIIESEIFLNLVCEFVVYDLERTKLKDFVLNYIKQYYDLRVQSQVTLNECEVENYEAITQEERQQFSQAQMNYNLEFKKVVEKQLKSLLSKVKKIARVQDNFSLESEDDFLKYILEQMKVLDVHKTIGFDPALINNIFTDVPTDNLFTRNNTQDEFLLQRYIKLPKIDRDSTVVRQYSSYFTQQKLDELDNKEIVSFEEAREIFVDMFYSIGQNISLFDCDRTGNSLFSEPYSFGLRVIYNDLKPLQNGPVYTINNEQYPYIIPLCQRLKAGFVKEETKEFNLTIIGDEKVKINQNETLQAFVQRNNLNRYNTEFFNDLKERLCKNEDVKLFFVYGLALKETSSLLLFHTNLVNNTLKMKYLLEPTKKKIEEFVGRLQKIGDKVGTSEQIAKIIESQKRERQNVGNPAGPLDFDALKMYIRTPIQLLKGLTTVVDPNVAIADKIIAGLSAAAAVTGNKIFLPYSLTSIALLPFPLFTPPPVGIIPPLTTYNITTPLFIPFFILEPLLWDLPYYKQSKSDKLLGPPICEDNED
jgi:hypothetical protein